MKYAHRFLLVSEGLVDYELTLDPDETVDCGFDWSRHLGTDTIAASSWTLPAGVSSSPTDSFTDDRTTLWPDGLTSGTRYACVNTITTTGGRTYARTLTLKTYV